MINKTTWLLRVFEKMRLTLNGNLVWREGGHMTQVQSFLISRPSYRTTPEVGVQQFLSRETMASVSEFLLNYF